MLHFRAGRERAPRPCSYCNKCLFNVLELPLGCYDERRYASREEMIREIYSVFQPPHFVDPVRREDHSFEASALTRTAETGT